jgi:uncharacterized membrane protein
MEPYVITFRILHIMSALAWYGASFLFNFFIEPTAKALGPDGGKFMEHLSKERKVSAIITTIAAITLVSGGFLYWRDSGGFDPDWITSDVGLGFTVGSVAAILAFVAGAIFIGPNVKRMGALGAEIEASGGPPTPDQMQRMEKIQHTLGVVGKWDFAVLTIAALSMAVARYLNF